MIFNAGSVFDVTHAITLIAKWTTEIFILATLTNDNTGTIRPISKIISPKLMINRELLLDFKNFPLEEF